MSRELTEAERDAFDNSAAHTNQMERYCCPHCYTDSTQHDAAGRYEDDPIVVECPHCGKEFIAWTEMRPAHASAKLPEPEDDDV